MKNRRSKYLILPAFQLPLIYMVIAFFLIFSFFVAGLVAYNFHDMISMGEEIGLKGDHPYFQFIRNQRVLFMVSLSAFLFLGVIANFIFILLFSHRMAGPIYKLLKSIEEYDGKKDVPVKFRENDFLALHEEKINYILTSRERKSE
jgi:hypothetical protein